MLKKLGLFALLVLAVVVLNYQLEDESKIEQPAAMITNEEAAYFANNLTREIFDKNGRQTQTLRAIKAEHYEQKNLLKMQHPKLHNKDLNNPWKIKAKSGTMLNQNKKIELNQQVVLTTLTPNQPQGLLKTEQLFYYPDEQIAETESKVQINYPNSSISATGMHAQLKQHIIYFKQGVISRHAPNPQPNR